ncbi:MAG TPA: alpha-D-ribose 1-methylphosphonate 5-triphosphate diphosphatase, partial [Candidatus Sulfotelmatobacter sp.]|nr:alpha-D-ribose 1-methylphosphonate 5-triphosphate diphosphatase [Candidatus Sulfotelmatobacter sp.]
MTSDMILTNAMVVAEDDSFAGTVVVRDGMIVAVDEGRSSAAGVLDLQGDHLLPGLVELHTDNLEKHVAPRPGVRWPMRAAVFAHDAQVAAAGITTVLDALTIAEARDSQIRAEMLADATGAIAAAQSEGMLRAEHFLHLRCEVAHETVIEVFEPYLGNPLLRLVSLMDHTPGQRQFVSVEKYYEYYQGRFGYSDAEMRELTERRIAAQKLHADRHRRELAALCVDRGLPTASHDDATLDHIDEAVAYGMTIAEFPTTREAAEAAHRHGMAVVMGSPNVVRGGSHSGNVSANELAHAGLLDILSSDYVPNSLLHSAFLLRDKLGLPLTDAVAKIATNPARMLGLLDRGAIAPGKRADLVRVALAGELP